MNASNDSLMLSHSIPTGEYISSPYPKAGEFSSYNLWEFKDAFEPSELIIKSGCRISFPRDYEYYNTQPGL